MEVFQMTIKDDIKAINKDIKKAKNFKWQVKRAEYWVIKLRNIYPDYDFMAYTGKNGIFLDYKVKGID